MGFGVTELLIILAIVTLLLGTKKLKTLGGDLGEGIKNFSSAIADEKKSEMGSEQTNNFNPQNSGSFQSSQSLLQKNLISNIGLTY